MPIQIPSYIQSKDKAGQDTYRVLLDIARAVNSLEATVSGHDAAIKAQLETKKPSPPIAPNTQITRNDMLAIQSALQANGTHPLDVSNLPGQLQDPQVAAIPTVTNLPNINATSPNTVVFQGGKIYQANYDDPTAPDWAALT